jgi:hypothetical protein
MYEYVEDREFLSRIRTEAGEILQDLCHNLKVDHDIGARFFLVGSGKRRLITRNANQPVDLDYNLEIVRCEDFEDCRYLKECVRKSFDKVLRARGFYWGNCQDSTSVLTAKRQMYFTTDPANYSIDVCIVMQDDGHYHRLIHKKAHWPCDDEYYWNIGPDSRALKEKEAYIHKHSKWELVRDQYLRLKNHYLTQNDHDHPSFICYIEAVNNVYNSRKHW